MRETGVSKVDGRAKNGEEKRKKFSSVLPIPRAAVPLARTSLSITVDEKRKGLRAVSVEIDSVNRFLITLDESY